MDVYSQALYRTWLPTCAGEIVWLAAGTDDYVLVDGWTNFVRMTKIDVGEYTKNNPDKW